MIDYTSENISFLSHKLEFLDFAAIIFSILAVFLFLAGVFILLMVGSRYIYTLLFGVCALTLTFYVKMKADRIKKEINYEREYLGTLNQQYFGTITNIEFYPSASATTIEVKDLKYTFKETLKMNICDTIYAMYDNNKLVYFSDGNRRVFKPENLQQDKNVSSLTNLLKL